MKMILWLILAIIFNRNVMANNMLRREATETDDAVIIEHIVFDNLKCWFNEYDPVQIGGCKCHESCDKCGWNTIPIHVDDCITCPEGVDLIPIHPDGSGTCGIPPTATPTVSASPSISSQPTPIPKNCWFNVTDPKKIRGCVCHETCDACGYSIDPTDIDDCITCPDGVDLIPLHADGTGTCGIPPTPVPTTAAPSISYEPTQVRKQCFLKFLIDIPGCECHETCETCGYSINPIQIDNCITCPDGADLTPLYADGTGTCGLRPTPTPTARVSGQNLFNRPSTAPPSITPRQPIQEPEPKTCWIDATDPKKIDGCVCHESCFTCGYSNNPIHRDDCITCPVGVDLFPLHDDGTGTCGISPTFTPTTSDMNSELDGALDGSLEGEENGLFDGEEDGLADDELDGALDGSLEGEDLDGVDDELADGELDDALDGEELGQLDGADDGLANGEFDDALNGDEFDSLGTEDGPEDGVLDGSLDGSHHGSGNFKNMSRHYLTFTSSSPNGTPTLQVIVFPVFIIAVFVIG